MKLPESGRVSHRVSRERACYSVRPRETAGGFVVPRTREHSLGNFKYEYEYKLSLEPRKYRPTVDLEAGRSPSPRQGGVAVRSHEDPARAPSECAQRGTHSLTHAPTAGRWYPGRPFPPGSAVPFPVSGLTRALRVAQRRQQQRQRRTEHTPGRVATGESAPGGARRARDRCSPRCACVRVSGRRRRWGRSTCFPSSAPRARAPPPTRRADRGLRGAGAAEHGAPRAGQVNPRPRERASSADAARPPARPPRRAPAARQRAAARRAQTWGPPAD